MTNRTTNIIASVMILAMAVLAITSITNDSLTMDEQAHLPAGYSYLTQQDMRLNPEHPPLIKDLAAIPLLFIKNIQFPQDLKAWTQDLNGQWDFGMNFLFKSGNPADLMIFLGRLPMILLLLILGLYLFKWTKELYGNKASLIALFFFCLSPTFLAQGRLVTTDVGAAFGILIATYYFLKSLYLPSNKKILISGIALGIAELLKFSAILLIPSFVFYCLVWWLLKMGSFKQTFKNLLIVFVIAFLLIWPVYQFHVWNYPQERQAQDANQYLSGYIDAIKNPVVWMSDKPIIRPYAQYLTGLLMIFNRVVGGNTTYFMGEVSNKGWRNYFPIVYLIKETLAFHLLTLIAVIYGFWFLIKAQGRKITEKISNTIKQYFSEFCMLSFIALYWLVSISGTLNIGVRHLLPAFPFTIILVSGIVASWIKEPFLKLKQALIAILMLWQVFSIASIYPHFLAYFNELAGGPDKGYIYVVDSNLDWGQDLKRLTQWVNKKGIDKIYLDYFGGADPNYYLKDKYSGWWCERPSFELPKGSYLAVSATFLQNGRGKPVSDFSQAKNCYKWLDNYQPIEKIGYSIFIYRKD